MPNSRKSSARTGAESPPSFEQALNELEAIVEKMENDRLPLDALIDHYEQGTRLFTTCNQLLGNARERLELITLKAREEASPEPGPAVESQADDEEEPEDDDIRLF
jgi:exodeoxyribonuclease VII small subunit